LELELKGVKFSNVLYPKAEMQLCRKIEIRPFYLFDWRNCV